MPAGAAEHLPPGAASCAGCHASAGAETGLPDLARLSPDDIASAMAAFRAGKRPGTMMPRLAQGFSDAETRAIADALGRRP